MAGLAVPLVLAYSFGTTSEYQVVAVVLGLLGAMLVLSQPFWGMIFFVGLLYCRPEETWPMLAGMRFTLMVAILALCGFYFRAALNREPLTRTPSVWMLVGFITWVAISIGGRGTASDAMEEVGKLVMIVFLAVNLVRSQKEYRLYSTSIIVFTLYLAIRVWHIYATGGALKQLDPDGEIIRGTATGLFSDPNDLAATFIAGLALTFVRIRVYGGWRRWVYAGVAGVLLYAIHLTQSRGGMLAFLVVVAGLMLLQFGKNAKAIVAAGIAGFLLLNLVGGRMTNFESTEESANQRFWYWDNAIVQLMENPINGCGYRMFTDLNGGMTAHNTFALCFAELGLPGYFFWMGFIYFCFNSRRAKALQSSEGESGGEGGSGGEGKPAKLDPDEAEIFGAKLAGAAYLMACFWISRTYVPVTYIILSVPLVAQLVALRAEAAGAALQPSVASRAVEKLRSIQKEFQERKPPSLQYDFAQIAMWCFVSIALVKILVEKYK